MKCSKCKRTDKETKFYNHITRTKQSRCAECQHQYMLNYRSQERTNAILAYGGPTPQCACPGCTENRLPFLTIDHTNGGGNQHRLQIGKGKSVPSTSVFRWLRNNNYPPGFRVLCYNCNTSRGIGKCPVHEITPFPLENL